MGCLVGSSGSSRLVRVVEAHPKRMHATGLSESLGRAVVEAEQCIHIWLGVEHFKIFWSLTGPNKLDGRQCVAGPVVSI